MHRVGLRAAGGQQMKRLIVLAAAFALVLGTGDPAEAAKPKKKAPAGATTDPVFAKLDTNSDGKLTRQEFSKLPTVMPAAAGLAGKKAGKKPGKGKGAAGLDDLFNKLARADTNTI